MRIYKDDFPSSTINVGLAQARPNYGSLYVPMFYFPVKQEKGLYEASQAIQYLDMTLQESMRLYTPVPK